VHLFLAQANLNTMIQNWHLSKTLQLKSVAVELPRQKYKINQLSFWNFLMEN